MMRNTFRIESLLAARLFLIPQRVGNRLFFVSNLSGRLSLYGMDHSGSVPELLLPPHIALMTPELAGGYLFHVFPRLERILLMLDRDGDEHYQPTLLPMTGGYPEPAFGDQLQDYRVHCTKVDDEQNLAYFVASATREQKSVAFRGDLRSGELMPLGESRWGCWVDGVSDDHRRVILIDGYTVGDHVLYLWTSDQPERRLLYGVPLEQRMLGGAVTPNAIHSTSFVGGSGLLFVTALFTDTYGLGYLDLERADEVHPVEVAGVRHRGIGELVSLEHLRDSRFRVSYNVDGASWVYEGRFDPAARAMRLGQVVCGEGRLSGGVVGGAIRYERASDSLAFSFSSSTSPTQLYTVEGPERRRITQHTRERVLGIPEDVLSPGEDAAYSSFDGLRISARLYLPPPALGYSGPRPLVYYVHGGPQSQERPDFAWFSMPLIQYLSLSGFAVFVPNVRGSTGYGLAYTKQVDRDWGGRDRLDHVHAITQVLPRDDRVDVSRAGVVGRSYGGYMTLTLAARHPDLWKAAVDMFGPYNLVTFVERIPESWKPYFAVAIGDPERDRDFLLERSPSVYIDQVRCPLLVIQGNNDVRLVEAESRDLVERLRAKGKAVDYLLFEDEGHDVLKFENKVRCYNAITDFFRTHL